MAKQLKDWFNKTFFNNDLSPKRAEEVAITISSKHGVMVLPTLEINHEHTLGMIVHAVYEYAHHGGPIFYSRPQEAESPQQSAPIETDPEVPVNFDNFTWRKKEYLVEHFMKEGERKFRVIRLEDKKELTAKHKTRGRLIKIFQDKYPE
ncbi:MAG: hypothetical protein AAF242_02695 [Bacteroidota bacterium]